MFKFKGHSDDIVEVNLNDDGYEHYGASEGIFATFNVGGQMRVHALYEGTWSFADGRGLV